jgi:hypothetical protein
LLRFPLERRHTEYRERVENSGSLDTTHRRPREVSTRCCSSNKTPVLTSRKRVCSMTWQGRQTVARRRGGGDECVLAYPQRSPSMKHYDRWRILDGTHLHCGCQRDIDSTRHCRPRPFGPAAGIPRKVGLACPRAARRRPGFFLPRQPLSFVNFSTVWIPPVCCLPFAGVIFGARLIASASPAECFERRHPRPVYVSSPMSPLSNCLEDD